MEMEDEDEGLYVAVKKALDEVKQRVNTELQTQRSNIQENEEMKFDERYRHERERFNIYEENINTNLPSFSFPHWMLPEGVESEVTGSWVSRTLVILLQEVVKEEEEAVGNAAESNRKAVVVASAFLDHTWQKLNTGHWKEVPLTWRSVFTWGSIALVGLLLQRLLSALRSNTPPNPSHLKEVAGVVRACDRGLLMGATVEDNPLHSIAAALNPFARLAAIVKDSGNKDEESPVTQEDPANVTRPLEVTTRPPLERFLLHYMETGNPVKLLGAVSHWPALKKWGLSYFRKVAGARTVPVEVGARYTDSSWYQRLMTVDEYFCEYVTGSGGEERATGYLAQHHLLDQVPQLTEDILVPDYCHLGQQQPRINVWVGPRGTVSPLHHDPDHNILVQVVGYKYIRLYREDQSHLLYAHPDPLLSNTSQADVETLTEDSWPLLQKAEYQDLILGPGEALYIPPRHWHYIRSLSTSFSVSFWWS